MKEETKELIKWAMAHLADYKTKLLKHEVENVNEDAEKEMCKKFAEFINSLPEIESHLCRGGYIQDRNGTPCCDGDKVRFEFKKKGYGENWSNRFDEVTTGVLSFSPETKNLVILFGCKGDWIDFTTSDYGCVWFEKVE